MIDLIMIVGGARAEGHNHTTFNYYLKRGMQSA